MRYINVESDFKLLESFDCNCEVNLRDSEFTFVYYTKQYSDNKVEVSYKDKICSPTCKFTEDNRLIVLFENHNLEPGTLKVKRYFNLNDADFSNKTCDFVIEEELPISLIKGIQPCTEECCYIDVKLPPYYQKGDIGPVGPKGDKGDKGDQGDKGDKGDLTVTGATPHNNLLDNTAFNQFDYEDNLSYWNIRGRAEIEIHGGENGIGNNALLIKSYEDLADNTVNPSTLCIKGIGYVLSLYTKAYNNEKRTLLINIPNLHRGLFYVDGQQGKLNNLGYISLEQSTNWEKHYITFTVSGESPIFFAAPSTANDGVLIAQVKLESNPINGLSDLANLMPTPWTLSANDLKGKDIYELLVESNKFEGTRKEFEDDYINSINNVKNATNQAIIEANNAQMISQHVQQVERDIIQKDSERQRIFETNEAIREENETSRQEAEVIREENERRREEAETNREATFQTNEAAREAEFGKAIQAAKNNLVVVNDLTTGGADKALSAEMGKELGKKLNYQIPTSSFSKIGTYSIHSLTFLKCLKTTEGGSYVTNSPVERGIIRISNINTAQAQVCFLNTNNVKVQYNHDIGQYLCSGETSAHGIEPGNTYEYEVKEPTYIYMVYGANGERVPKFEVINLATRDDFVKLQGYAQEIRKDLEESIEMQAQKNEEYDSKTEGILQVISSLSFDTFAPSDGSDIKGKDEDGLYTEVIGDMNIYSSVAISLSTPSNISNTFFKKKKRFSLFAKFKLSTEEANEDYNVLPNFECIQHVPVSGMFLRTDVLSFEKLHTHYIGDIECVGGIDYPTAIKVGFKNLRRVDQNVVANTRVTCKYYGLYIVPTDSLSAFIGREARLANLLDYTNIKTNFIVRSIYSITSENSKDSENAKNSEYSAYADIAHILDTPYRGKVVKAIGDSLVTFISWKNFQNLLGISSVQTGQGGGKVCNNDPVTRHGFCTLERLAMLPRAMKLLVIYGGANDGVKTSTIPYEIDPNKLGNINDKPLAIADMCNYRVKNSNVTETNTPGRAQTFYQGYKTLLRNIQALYPDCQLLCVTQHRYYNYVLPNGTFSQTLVPTMGSAEKVIAIKEVAAEYAVPVCDLWETSGVNDLNNLHTLIDSEGVAVHQTTKTAAIEEALILNKVLEIAPKFDVGKFSINRSDDTVMEMRQWVIDVRSDEECNVMTLEEAIQAFIEKVEADGIEVKKNMILTFYYDSVYNSKVYFLNNEANPSSTSSWEEWTIQKIDDPNDPND